MTPFPLGRSPVLISTFAAAGFRDARRADAARWSAATRARRHAGLGFDERYAAPLRARLGPGRVASRRWGRADRRRSNRRGVGRLTGTTGGGRAGEARG